MGKIRELYDTRVRPMSTSERLQLARLILDDLAPALSGSEAPIDTRDDWCDEDVADVAAFSARQGGRAAPGDSGGGANDQR